MPSLVCSGTTAIMCQQIMQVERGLIVCEPFITWCYLCRYKGESSQKGTRIVECLYHLHVLVPNADWAAVKGYSVPAAPTAGTQPWMSCHSGTNKPHNWC